MQPNTIIWFLVTITAAVATGMLLGKLYGRVFMRRLARKNVELGCEAFLNGFEVWRYEQNGTFTRIGHYIGHGLCYEASALLMLVWRDFKKTRYVFGRAYSSSCHEWVQHAWMEVKAYGIWWVFDCTWMYPVHPVPRLLHRLHDKAFSVRNISHKKFFNYEVSTKMAEMIRDPATSYFFHDLCCFRRSSEGDRRQMIMEFYDSVDFIPNGKRPNVLLVGIFKKGRPITQRIIREFVTRDQRKVPKKHSFRKAVALERTVDRYYEEAQAWHEETGDQPVLRLTSLKTFEILSVAEAEKMGFASSS